MSKRFFCGLALFIMLFLFMSHSLARAATMYLLPATQSVSIGQEFTVDVKINTSDSSTNINAAQATIQFPVNILSAVSVSTQSSTFGFWLTGPTVSNDDGTIQFIGGTIKGIGGSALEVAQITFKATGAGSADLTIAGGAVLAADGKGTNVLAGTQGASVVVATTVVPLLPDTGTMPSEQLTPIDRTPSPATELPAAPTLSVPLYPDQSRWYNQLGDTIILWNVPADITQVATSINHAEGDSIGITQPTLSNGQDLGILKDGIWYVRVQFKNNIGWGPPSYYKISIDTTPPLPFDIQIENAGTDDPSPSIHFETSDSLSGIAGYTISIDGEDIAQTTSTSMLLPPQLPGTHTLVVKASDLAGNTTQDDIPFTIVPLPTPRITFAETSISQGALVFASGNAVPSSSVEVKIVDANNREVFDGTVPADSDGNWEATVQAPLAIGTYFLSATDHNSQGAVSLPSTPQAFVVVAPSVISFGILQLGWLEIFIIAILLAITAASLWSRWYMRKKQKRGSYNTIAVRDIEKMTDMLSVNIKDLVERPSVKNAGNDPDLAYTIGKMEENVAKIKKYIKQELEKLR